MTKTPEQLAASQLAEEYCNQDEVACAAINHDAEDLVKDAFIAGYKAAKEEEATKDQKIAELWTESIRRMLPSVHEITLFPSKQSEEK